MTMQEILAQVAAGTLNPADAGKLIVTETPKTVGGKTPAPPRFQVSYNKSGGVYLTHPSFKAYSNKKSKQYQACLNLDAAVAKALFGNPAVLAECSKAVTELLETPAPAMAAS